LLTGMSRQENKRGKCGYDRSRTGCAIGPLYVIIYFAHGDIPAQ